MIPKRLPDRPVKAMLVSGEYPELAERIRQLKIEVIVTQEDVRLPKSVRWHPDMQICSVAGRTFVLKGSALIARLSKHSILAEETVSLPSETYPHDVLCNVLSWNRCVLGNPKTADKEIIQAAKENGLEWIAVNQGYTACSTVLVNENAAITADKGIAKALDQRGMEVLQISPGFIELPGYEYGFIGGCCGKLAPDLLAFTGRLDSHPDGEKIADFLGVHHIQYVELINRPLIDVGGLISFH